MEQIPDAPWIRETERDGIPSPEYPECPVCGCECRTLIFNKFNEIVGCNVCTEEKDADEWLEQKREDEEKEMKARFRFND